ncbi:hypothetical protein TM49_11345 [Martelella endophytica]|uniref:DUF8173 domain-containing protein n=2 Tax=Martelella endophytica TaxID=1486262 RepID=A0A0D5LPT1_MAREN|nr:hypothetical protein TM49_11345 [Martelella endophytica]
MLLAALLFAAPAALADDDTFVFGGDTYASGATPSLRQDSPRSAFLSGFSVTLDGAVTRNAHLAGARVRADGPVSGDLYAAGFSVDVDGAVAGDVSIAGANIEIGESASIGGNARLFGGTVEVDAPITGSLLAAAGNLTLNAPISGDAMFAGDEISFGPDATIGGTLTYSAPEEIDIPESVISPEKVTFHKLTPSVTETTDEDEALVSSDTVKVTGYITTLVFMLALAAFFLTFTPTRVEAMRARLMTRPLASLGYGFLALSMLIGAVPVALLTLVAIPLIPFVVLATVIAWTLAYLLAVFALSWWVVTKIRPMRASLLNMLLATAAGLVLMSLLHYLPFFGWIANMAVVLIGLGAMAAICGKGLQERRLRRTAPPAAPVPATPSEPAEPPELPGEDTPPRTQ